MKAIRQVFVEQYGEEIKRQLRVDFAAFYEGEIMKANKIRMNLTVEEVDSLGQMKIKPSENFVRVMGDYFRKLAVGEASEEGFRAALQASGLRISVDGKTRAGGGVGGKATEFDDDYYSEDDGAGGRRRRRR